jgi:hypothetical protein
MCKRFDGRRVPPRHCRHQGRHRSPRVTRHAAATRRTLVRKASRRSGTRPSPASARRREGTKDRRCRLGRRRCRGARDGATDQALGEPPGRGRRDCMWSLSRIGRVSSSPSRPSGAVQLPRGGAGRPVRVARGASATAGTRPVSTAPGARCRPAAPGAGVVATAPSGARRRPAVGVSAISGARRRPVTGISPVSGARRRPTDANCAVSSAVRRPPVAGRSWTTESSRSFGRFAVAAGSASADRARRPDGCRATDISWVGRPRWAAAEATDRWRSGSRSVARSV